MELVLPQNYVELEQEEMMYLDGGAFISKIDCLKGMSYIGISPYTYIAGAVTFVMAKALIKKAAALSGLAAIVVSTILSWAVGQVVTFGAALARGAIYNGVDISWNWNIFKEPVGIKANVRY